MAPEPLSESSRLRLRAVVWGGLLCLGTGLLLNPWVLRLAVSDDGHLEPLTVARVQLVQIVLGVAGALILASRRRLARPAILQALLRERPHTSALLFGVALTLVLWLCVEAAFWWVNRRQSRPVVVRVTATDGSIRDTFAVADERLGYKLVPGLSARIRLTDANGRVLYDIDSVTDQYSRRVTPVTSPDSRTEYALFFGCSFTWGDAVQGHETLPAAFGTAAPRFQPHNYGFRGYGPQQMLVRLRDEDLRGHVPQPSGLAVFTIIDEHIARSIGSMRVATSLRGGFPYFRLEPDNTLAQHGSFVSGRPWLQLWYDFLSRSQLLNHFNVDLPLRITDEHLELVAALIDESRKHYRMRFGSDRFYILLYPQSVALRRLKPHLDHRGLRYLDYTAMFDAETRPVLIEGDGHPTPLAYRLVARRLARDLGVEGHPDGGARMP